MQKSFTIRQRVKNWLRLIRVPNLFTVPGDLLAGFFIATYSGINTGLDFSMCAPLAGLIFISLLTYSAGLIDNDLQDVARDKALRPDRPIPSGAISPRHAAVVMLCMIAAVMFGAFLLAGKNLYSPIFRIAGGLVAAVLLYNRIKNCSKILGAFLMGICRGANILLGAVLLGWSGAKASAPYATAVAIYIIVVTLLATQEAKYPKLPAIIGVLIRLLIPIQIVAILWVSAPALPGIICSALLCLCFFASRSLARKFYAS